MKVLIAGAGRLGTQVAQVLSATRNDVTLVEHDEDRITEIGDLPAVHLMAGDACEPVLLERAGALTCDLVIAATGRDEDNLVISLLAKRRFGVARVAARVNDAENAWLFDGRWGVDVAVPAATPLISLIEEATGATDTVALLRLSKAGCRGHRDSNHRELPGRGSHAGRNHAPGRHGRGHRRPRRASDSAGPRGAATAGRRTPARLARGHRAGDSRSLPVIPQRSSGS